MRNTVALDFSLSFFLGPPRITSDSGLSSARLQEQNRAAQLQTEETKGSCLHVYQEMGSKNHQEPLALGHLKARG